MTIATFLHTLLRGKLIGKDNFGNRYYEDRQAPAPGYRRKRWVMYKGIAEPSKVPAAWHGWLHYTTDRVPEHRYAWQKEHEPNLTGTKEAYYPSGHILKGGKRDEATGDYEAWKP